MAERSCDRHIILVYAGSIALSLIHVLSGAALLSVSGYLFLLSFFYNRAEQEENGLPALVLLGLFFGFILFSGVFQLGSIGTFSEALLWKLGATFLGGGLSVVGGLARFRANCPVVVYALAQFSAFLLFGFSFYLGWSHI